MATITVKGLIDEADKVLKQRDKIKEEQMKPLNEQAASLREILRHLVKAGQASPEEAAWVAEAFPPREFKRGQNGDSAEEGDEE